MALKARKTFNLEWAEYDYTLREIAGGRHPGPLPKQPSKYPDEV